MDDAAHRKHQKQVTEVVEKTIVDSHSFPSGHGFPGYTPFTSVLKEMRYREMGDRRLRLDKIWPSLLKNKNREFQQSHELRTRGDTMLDCKRAVSASGIIDLEEEVARGFVHERERFDGQGIRQILVADTEALVRNGAHLEKDNHSKRVMEKYVILLTNLGQVRLYAEEENQYVLAHRFNLPAHLFTFKSLAWNVEKDEIYAVGVAPRTHIDDIGDDQFSHTSRRTNSTPFARSYALAVISLHPEVVVKYLVRLDSQMFGHLSSVSLHGDALICMTPKSSNIYDMNELCSEYIQSVPTPTDYGSPTSDRVVLFNMIIGKKPQPLRIFFGSLYSIDIGCTSMHVILQYNRGRSECRIEGCDGGEPVFVDEWRETRHSKMVIYHGEGGDTRFHPDASPRIIRFEGDHLKCYTIQSAAPDEKDAKYEDNASRVSLLWSVKLLPPSRLRAPSPEEERDLPMHTNIVHSIKLVPGNMLMIIMIYNAHMEACSQWTPPYLYCPVAIFLDSRTGRLVRVTPVPNTVFFSRDSVQCDGLGGLFSVGTADETDTKTVRIHRLVEREREKEFQIVQPKSGVLNRKQRRLKRKAEAQRQNDTPRDITSLFPGSHEIV